MRKIQLFSIVFSMCFISNFLHAQHWRYYNPTYGFDVNTVNILGPGIIAIGGGREANDSVQVMFLTTDYGSTWNENTHDGYAPWNKSIAFSDLLNGYGVGYDGRIIRSVDAGRNWGWPTTPVIRDFNKIIYACAGTFYIAGGNKTHDSLQTILKSTDYGSIWNTIYDTQGPWLKSICFIDTLKGFAVGDNGVILATINGGNTWASVTAPVQRDFNAITFIDADSGYIVGGNSSLPFRRTILQTVNGGINWSVLKDTAGGILKDISFADTLVGYTVGDNATVLKTIDGGSNWSPIIIDTSLNGYETFNAVKFYNRNFGAIGGKSGLLYVYQNRQVEVYTFGTGQVGSIGATLLGGINTHTKNASYSWVYSNDLNFTTSVLTQEINVINDSLLLISEPIQGLSPNMTYYYFLKAVTASDTIYGDTLCFYTGVNTSFDYQTLDATMVGVWSANLNGFINKFPEPVSLFFEYGDSPAFGSEISATPATMNDTLMHNIRAQISRLQANKWYFFRLKGVTGSGVYHGDTKIFRAIDLPYVSTGNISYNSMSSVQLNGSVSNSFPFPIAVKFEYGLTPRYGTEVTSVPDSITGTGNYSAYYLLTGISPTSTYHYRIKAINQLGTSYGEDKTFITGGPLAYTFPASDFGVNSAKLNGAVNANSYPTAVKFEYGLTDLYGTEINALPDTVADSIMVFASGLLTGLFPTTTYHYRIKAANANGIHYGRDTTFTTGTPFASTLSASNIGPVSAQLNGVVNANNFPTTIKFEYGTTPSFGNEITPIPDSATGDSNIYISCQLNGLLPDSTYHYRVYASNQIGIAYGNDMIFSTNSSLLSMITLTLPATEITQNSARLNGTFDAYGIPTAIKFEYGLTQSYGNEVVAVPDSSSDHDTISVYGMISGLMPNTTYHYRLKGVNSIFARFGEDKIFFTGDSEIPNFDFEMWTPVGKLNGWDIMVGKITRYSPSCHNNYAVKIENDITQNQPGAILIGNTFTRGQSFIGGTPFNSRPDTLIGCFNYSIPENDTALVGLLLKKQGLMISSSWFEIYGNSSGNYTDLKFPISYTSGEHPDSLILGITVTDIRHIPSQFPAGGYLIVDNLRLTGTTENIPNNDFENWGTYTNYSLDGWFYKTGPFRPEEAPVIRTTDAQHGSYAVHIKTSFSTTDTVQGYISTSQQWNTPGFRVNTRHQALTGYYRFSPENNDTMKINVVMFKNHVLVGQGTFLSTYEETSWSPFIVDIAYFTSEVPDSASITIQTFSGWPPLGRSVLYADNLNFDGFLSGIKEPALMNTPVLNFNIYPNPFSNQAVISFTISEDKIVMVRLFDISGKQARLLTNERYKPGEHRINISASGLDKGFYICIINTGDLSFSRKIVIY